MIEMRNSLVAVQMLERTQDGPLVIPDVGSLFAEARIVAVGPGTVSAEGGRSETHDLQPGQRVLIKHKRQRHAPPHPPENEGVRYRYGGVEYVIFEQTNIIAILPEPESKDLA